MIPPGSAPDLIEGKGPPNHLHKMIVYYRRSMIVHMQRV